MRRAGSPRMANTGFLRDAGSKSAESFALSSTTDYSVLHTSPFACAQGRPSVARHFVPRPIAFRSGPPSADLWCPDLATSPSLSPPLHGVVTAIRTTSKRSTYCTAVRNVTKEPVRISWYRRCSAQRSTTVCRTPKRRRISRRLHACPSARQSASCRLSRQCEPRYRRSLPLLSG
jgi:hypothetical protein